MSFFMNASSIAVLLAAVLALAAFAVALRRRWLSNLRQGYLFTLMIALVGTGVISSLVVGVWCYQSATHIIWRETVEELGDVCGMLEDELQRGVDKALEQMTRLAAMLAPAIARGPSKELQDKLNNIIQVNGSGRCLQVNLYEKGGRLLATASSEKAAGEAPNRIATAYGLDGRTFTSDPYMSPVFNKYVICLSVPVQSPEGEILGVLTMRADLDEIRRLLAASRFGESGYAMLVNYDGRILGHPDPGRIGEDISDYPAVKLGMKGSDGSVVAPNNDGARRLFFYRTLKGPGTVNPKPMLLVTEMDEKEALAPLIDLKYRFLFGIGFVVLACLVIAQRLSSYIKKPFQTLLQMFERVEAGDLSMQHQIRARDEIGQLESGLDRMVEGLRERNMVKELFGRYVTTQVSEQVLNGRVNLGGEVRRVTILFSDIRDFTSTAEKMEPMDVVAFLNEYFSEMVEAVFEYGGVLDKFLGDGMMAVFGSFDDEPDHPRTAIMAALRMKALLGKINGKRSITGQAPIKIGIGIHTDEVIVGNIGSQKRLEYTVIGDGVNTCSRVESLNKEFGTTILITSTTYEEVKDFFECRLMPEVQIKGKARALKFYEVVCLKKQVTEPSSASSHRQSEDDCV
jgi:class 3 adenylate cyclase